MSDRAALWLVVAAAIGALHPSALPPLAGVAAVLLAMPGRRSWLLLLGVTALASSLAGRALTGLDEPPAETVHGEVTLLTDPVVTATGARAEVRLGRRHLELRAGAAVARSLRPRLAGERLMVRGRLEPVPSRTPWQTSRHVAGRLRVHAVESWRPGTSLERAANGVRRTLEAGAASLPDEQGALFAGLTIGDDRRQPVGLSDDFLGAGLTHLLAVSGQNVAFALALAGPLLRRTRLWPRLVLTLAVIGAFGLMTRFEPSVLRAAAMAGLASMLGTVGAPASRLGVLAVAITGLLLVDPLLVHSVGFQLSTAAAGAIVVAGPAVARVLPGPSWLRDALGVTVAAQVGVAPVLLATFGPLPVASLPANLLAVPAAGPVMVWGLTAGLAAGVLGEPTATLLHVPTRLLDGWNAAVARRSSALPLGALGPGHVAVLALGLWVATRRRTAGLLLAGAAVVAAILAAHAPVALRSELRPGVVRWHADATDVVVLGGGGWRTPLGAPAVLAALREAGVRELDLLVLADAAVRPELVAAVESRHAVGAVVEGPAGIPTGGAELALGSLVVRLTPVADRVVTEARRR